MINDMTTDKGKRQLTIKGRMITLLNITEKAKELGIPYRTMQDRWQKGKYNDIVVKLPNQTGAWFLPEGETL